MRPLLALALLLTPAAATADPPTDEQLVARLADADANTRRAAAVALGRRKAEANIGPLAKAVGDPDKGVRDAAAYALLRTGERSFGPLAAALDGLPVEGQRLALMTLIELAPKAGERATPAAVAAVAKQLAAADTDVRVHAAYLLGLIGPPAKGSLPKLYDRTADFDRLPYMRPRLPSVVAVAAAEAVLKIDPTAREELATRVLPKLIEMLNGKDADTAAQVIAVLGKHGRPAEKALLARYQKADTYSAFGLRSALRAIGSEEYYNQLERAIRDDGATAEKRAAAVRDLQWEKADDPRVGKLLTVAVADAEPKVRAAAVGVCSFEKDFGKAVGKPLLACLGDRKLEAAGDDDRDPTETLAGAIRNAGPDLLPGLTDVLADGKTTPLARLQAARAVRRFGRTGREAAAGLLATMACGYPAVEAEAAVAYLAVGGDAAKAVPVFERALDSRTASVQAYVLHRLKDAGGRLDNLAPRVAGFLDSRDAEVRIAAARTLAKFGPTVQVPAKKLGELMLAGDGRERYQMAAALGELGPRAADAAPALVRALDKLEAVFPEEAMTALGKLGPKAEPAVPKLIALVEAQGRQEFHSSQAMEVLADIGPAAKAAVPALTARLKDPKDYRRPRALMALGCIGADAKAALPAVEPLVEDESPAVRAWAHFALARLTGRTEQYLVPLRDAWAEHLATGRSDFGSSVRDLPDVCTRLGADARLFRDVLVDDFCRPDVPVGLQATMGRVLARFPQDAAAVVPRLTATLDRSPRDIFDRDRLKTAATTLAAFGPAAAAAVPKLKKLAESEYDDVATAAAAAVEAVGKK